MTRLHVHSVLVLGGQRLHIYTVAALCVYYTSKVRSITEAGSYFAIPVDHIQDSVLDEVHLGPDGPVLCDVVPGQEYVEGDPGDYGGDEGLAGSGKEWDNSDEVLASVIQDLLQINRMLNM